MVKKLRLLAPRGVRTHSGLRKAFLNVRAKTYKGQLVNPFVLPYGTKVTIVQCSGGVPTTVKMRKTIRGFYSNVSKMILTLTVDADLLAS